MRKFTKPDLPREHERRFWQGIRAGLSVDEAAASAGASWSWGRKIFVRLGGVNPTKPTEPSGQRYLRFEEREEIMRLQASGLDIYFCDPHSPWQRGTNENTNGLLRQYLPKGSDLSFYGPGMLDNIAAELNSRPRKRHGFRTPAEMLAEILAKSATEHGVA